MNTRDKGRGTGSAEVAERLDCSATDNNDYTYEL